MKNKINILRAILIIMLLFMLNIIFGFSSQDGEQSSSLSRQITETITKEIKSIQKLEKNEKEKILNNIEHIIRKCAHFTLYMIVGFLLMSLFSTYKIKQKNRFLISFIISLIYAISDEIHQMFTPGRSPMITDIIIDSLGAITGIIIAFCLVKLILKQINPKKQINFDKNIEKNT